MASDKDELAQLRERALARWEHLQRNWRRRALRNRSMTRTFTYGSVVLSVATATLSGLSAVPRWAVVIASGGAALAAALIGATRSSEQWVLSRGVQNNLYHERFMFEQRAGVYGDETLTDTARVQLFSERISGLGLAAHGSWAGHVSEATSSVRDGS